MLKPVTKRMFAYAIVGFWAVMATLFVRREILPGLFALPAGGYASLRAYALGHAQDRMGVYLADGAIRIGTTETTYQLKENGDCEISSHLVTEFEKRSLAALGHMTGLDELTKLEFWFDVTIGPDDRLRSFWVSRDKDGASTLASGQVVLNELRVSLSLGGQTVERRVPISPDDMLAGGMSSLSVLRSPREGQAWQIRTLDPLTFKFTTVSARVKKKTRIQLRGAWYPVYEVELWQPHAVARCWVTETGEVLKEEAPPLVLIREPLPHELARRKPPGESTRPGSSR